MLQWQVIPRFAEELCRKDLGSADEVSCNGFNLTADMHRRGIGVRHMGLLRDMFWRPLHGTVDLSFNSNRVRTKTDMRLQLRRGDQVSGIGATSENHGLPIWARSFALSKNGPKALHTAVKVVPRKLYMLSTLTVVLACTLRVPTSLVFHYVLAGSDRRLRFHRQCQGEA